MAAPAFTYFGLASCMLHSPAEARNLRDNQISTGIDSSLISRGSQSATHVGANADRTTSMPGFHNITSPDGNQKTRLSRLLSRDRWRESKRRIMYESGMSKLVMHSDASTCLDDAR